MTMGIGPLSPGCLQHVAAPTLSGLAVPGPERLLPGMQPGARKRNVLVVLCYLIGVLLVAPKLVEVASSALPGGGT